MTVSAAEIIEPRTRAGARSLRPRNFLIYLTAVTFVGFSLFPLYMIFTTALKTETDIFASPPVWLFKPTLKNFFDAFFVFGGQGVLRFLLNSLVVTLVSTALAVTLGAMAGYGLARYRFAANKHLAFYILSTRFAPPVWHDRREGLDIQG